MPPVVTDDLFHYLLAHPLELSRLGTFYIHTTFTFTCALLPFDDKQVCNLCSNAQAQPMITADRFMLTGKKAGVGNGVK